MNTAADAIKLSIIVCTYNRGDSLRKTLQSISASQFTSELAWELLVVDNRSTDHTRDVCRAFSETLPIKYLYEPQQGKSYALNHGIAAAHGDLVAFTDDDVDVDPYWLSELCAGAERTHQADFWGGPVYPKWEVPPPAWLAEHSLGMLGSISVHYERAPGADRICEDDVLFVGANLMVRKKVFEQNFRFREDIGPNAQNASRQEDTLFVESLLQAGYEGYYIPKAKVYHRNSKERMTERYLRLWNIGAGISAVRLGQVITSKHMWWRAPRYLWRNLLTSCVRYVLGRWTQPSQIWLRDEINMATTWGMISEFRRQNGNNKK
jgi:glycosyltransferase involved in cell wall biosynthesis